MYYVVHICDFGMLRVNKDIDDQMRNFQDGLLSESLVNKQLIRC